MKRKTCLLLAPMMALLLSGCDLTRAGAVMNNTSHSYVPTSTSTKSSSSSSYIPLSGKVEVNVPSIMGKSHPEGYNVEIDFDDAYFNLDATKFSDELKMLSFGASMVTESDSKAKDFYSTLGFKVEESHLSTPTANSIGYVLASRDIQDKKVIAISVRGLNYGPEWANNTKLGKEGNHAGFDECATLIFDTLKSYISISKAKGYKLWINGYSRGAGVANVLASKILTSDLAISKNNMFVYTFETPRGLSKDNAIEYENVFNMVNEYDLVAKIAPEEYGLYRCGIDVIIDKDKNIDEVINEFDPEMGLPEFSTVSDTFENEQAFVDFLMKQLLEDTGDPATTLSTREGFANNYQDYIGYAIGMYMVMPQETVDKIMNSLSELGMGVLTMLNTPDGVYNFLKPIFDEDHIPYEDELLHNACNALQNFAVAKIMLLVYVFLSEDFKNDLMRLIYFHSTETVYALMK